MYVAYMCSRYSAIEVRLFDYKALQYGTPCDYMYSVIHMASKKDSFKSNKWSVSLVASVQITNLLITTVLLLLLLYKYVLYKYPNFYRTMCTKGSADQVSADTIGHLSTV